VGMQTARKYATSLGCQAAEVPRRKGRQEEEREGEIHRGLTQ
jgi:hypothetical protein